ncbi:MAG TPA: hypothetical protein VK857_05830 [Desulforhopalus sp.]|nr:hypothetical protein [Desulforhopalus sp.]
MKNQSAFRTFFAALIRILFSFAATGSFLFLCHDISSVKGCPPLLRREMFAWPTNLSLSVGCSTTGNAEPLPRPPNQANL